MARQLTLIDTDPRWRLDEQTREVGRRGVAAARAALAHHHGPGAEAREQPTGRGPRRAA